MQNTYWDAQKNKEIIGKKAVSTKLKLKSDIKSSKIVAADSSMPSDTEDRANRAARRPAPINPGEVGEDGKQTFGPVQGGG